MRSPKRLINILIVWCQIFPFQSSQKFPSYRTRATEQSHILCVKTKLRITFTPPDLINQSVIKMNESTKMKLKLPVKVKVKDNARNRKNKSKTWQTCLGFTSLSRPFSTNKFSWSLQLLLSIHRQRTFHSICIILNALLAVMACCWSRHLYKHGNIGVNRKSGKK